MSVALFDAAASCGGGGRAGPGGVVVLASAGTGKTFSLTNRYLGLLFAGADPTGVIASTFTRKAAAEILERVLSRLVAGAQGGKGLDELREFVSTELNEKDCAGLAKRIACGIDRVGVWTLDGLFGRLATAHGAEIGLSPGWSVLDPDEESAFLEEAAERALERAFRRGEHEQVRVIFERAQSELPRGGPGQLLVKIVGLGESVYLRTLDNPGVWEVIGGDVVDEPSKVSIDAAIAALQANAASLVPMTKAEKPELRWMKEIEKLAIAASASNWDSVIASEFVGKVVRGETYYGKHAKDALVAHVRPIYEHARAVQLSKMRRSNIAMRELLARVHVELESLKARAGRYSFSDIPRALARSAASHGLGDLYMRLDARLDHLLLDEFQDTSVEQYGLLEPVIDELLSGEGADEGSRTRSVFVVGDVKQSLYGWRQAEPELLARMGERWPQLDVQTLELSFRSSAVVMDAVNAVFEGIGSDTVIGEGSAGVRRFNELFRPHAAHKQGLQGFAAVVGVDAGEKPSADERRAAVASWVARRVASIRERVPAARVAVLVRRNKALGEMVAALAGVGIDAVEERGNPLTDSPVVAAAVSLLHLADHPSDSAAAFHVASGPLGEMFGLRIVGSEGPSVGDVRRAAERVRRVVRRSGYARVLEVIGERLRGEIAGDDAARYAQLVELAEAWESRGGDVLRPGVFAAHVREKGVAAPAGSLASMVRVMTVHAAKGLEFDAVILGDLEHRWGTLRETVLVERADVWSPVTAVSRSFDKRLRALEPRLEQMYLAEVQRSIFEEMCGLYVGMTRAVHSLEMPVSFPLPGGESLTAARVLAQRLGGLGQNVVEHVGGEEAMWSIGDPDWNIERRGGDAGTVDSGAGDASDAVAAAKPVELTKGTLRGLASRRSASPSGGGRLRGASLVVGTDENRDRSADVGTLVHAALAEIGWAVGGEGSFSVDESALLRLAGLNGIADESVVREACGILAGCARSPALCALFVRRGEGDEVRTELPFAVRVEDSMQVGRFDRVVKRAEEADVEVVDFKTDRVEVDDVGVDAALAGHLGQMSAYRRAASVLFGVEKERVRVLLALLRAGRVWRLAQDGAGWIEHSG